MMVILVVVILKIVMIMVDIMALTFIIILIVRGFPVTSLPCNNTIAEVWNTNLKVAQDDDSHGDSYEEGYGGSLGHSHGGNDDDVSEDYDDNRIQVQTLCMIEAPTSSLNSGLLFKSFFTSVISNIFGVTR